MPKDSIPLGWCLAGQHDTDEQRGAARWSTAPLAPAHATTEPPTRVDS